MKYKLFIIVNNIPTQLITDSLTFARKLFLEVGIDFDYKFKFLNEPLNIVQYSNGKGLNMDCTNRFVNEAVGCQTILYFYQPDPAIVGLNNYTYNLGGRPQIQIPVQINWPIEAIGECVAHELVHACFVSLTLKGISLVDTLDINNEGLKSIKERLALLSLYRDKLLEPLPIDTNKNIPKWLIVHHTETQGQTFEQINEFHRQKWNLLSSLGFYLGYHYFIDIDGSVRQARADVDEGAHCIGYNLKSIGIGLNGNFDITTPTIPQINSLKKLLLELALKYKIPNNKIVPHRRFSPKTCYGSKLSDSWAADLVINENLSTQKKLAEKILEILRKLLKL